MNELKTTIKNTAKQLFDIDVDVLLTRPDEQFGDFSTNVAMQIAPKIGEAPRQIAEKIADAIHSDILAEKPSVAGPGFINFRLSDQALLASLDQPIEKNLSGQEILVEFGDPNPFKEMHIGHAYSYVVGDSIATLLEAVGAKVHRLSYHGDVGLHVAKAIWGMQKTEMIDFDAAGDVIRQQIGMFYSKGAKAYEEDEKARDEIHVINEHIYKNDDPNTNKLYEWGRDKSLVYFDNALKDLDIKGGKKYFESQTAGIGEETVRKYIGKVFKESEGAIVFDGEKIGLHTRVFITSKGLPTYETKDLGLAELKKRDYPKANRSIIITANEQAEYFKVMLGALAEFDKPLAESITHLSHGFVSLSSGKMSSRTGDVYSAVSFILDVEQAIEKQFGQKSESTRNAAIKYGFLKHRLGSDIVYDVAESVSLQGNSGPYLQYAYVRAHSIIEKSNSSHYAEANFLPLHKTNLQSAERSLVRKLSEFPYVIAKATEELMPHHICNYLYELAQTFNRFYEGNRVIGDEREQLRYFLVETYKNNLKTGLEILNIPVLERM